MNIKLSEYRNLNPNDDRYELDPTQKYVLMDFESELEMQSTIMMSFQIIGAPPALKNYHAWLYKNGFDINSPNPTNRFVSSYYGKEPLWKTDYSQGIVVKVDGDDDYFIVMECSSKNKGYRHKRIVLTLGGCL